MPESPVIVAVTGAAGQIGYALAPLLASGALLGAGTPVALRLLEVAVPAVQTALGGLAMELDDAAYPTLASVTATADPAVAFAGAHVAILVGAFPRKAGVERGELLRRNGGIFRAQGAALAAHAHPAVKVLIVGNPANTNALILARAAAGRIPPRNITALTRLDHNRVVGALARHFGVLPSAVSGVAIWGNHSSTQYPDVTRARVAGAVDAGGVVAALGGRAAVAETFIPMIQKRGAAIIAARGASSAASAAAAIGDHVRSWLLGDPAVVSMAVCSQGEYGVEPGVFFSFPVRCTGGGAYEVVEGLELDDFSRKYIAASADELYAERSEALAVCASL